MYKQVYVVYIKYKYHKYLKLSDNDGNNMIDSVINFLDFKLILNYNKILYSYIND